MNEILDYGSSFSFWRRSTSNIWKDYINHEFVKGLRDGTLPRECFLFYLCQDYVFLEHFARAWALAVVKAGNLEEMEAAVTIVNALIHDEMQSHVKFCKENGIDQSELSLTVEAPANLAYTRYVLETGYTGNFLDLMAVLAPCVFGYGEIGKKLGQKVTEGPFFDWVSIYSGAEYQDLCVNLGEMIDKAILIRLGEQAYKTPTWKALCTKFSTATKLEVDFWQMGINLK